MKRDNFLFYLQTLSHLDAASCRELFCDWLNHTTREEVFNQVLQYLCAKEDLSSCFIDTPDFECIQLLSTDIFSLELHCYCPISSLSDSDYIHLFHNHGNHYLSSYHLIGKNYGYSSFTANSIAADTCPKVSTYWSKPGEIVQLGTDVYHSLINPKGMFATLVLWDSDSSSSIANRIFYYKNEMKWHQVSDLELKKIDYGFERNEFSKYLRSRMLNFRSDMTLNALENSLMNFNNELPFTSWDSEGYDIPWNEMNYLMSSNEKR